MKAIILVGGKSTRMRPLTLKKPKPLLRLNHKTLIEYSLDQLKSLVEEVILVVGYKKEAIKKYLGNSYDGLKLRYVTQEKQLGTAHALRMCKNKVKGGFLVLMGDDLYFRDDIKRLLFYRYAVLAKKVKNPQRFGVFIAKGNKAVNLVEKPKNFVSDLANTGCYKLDKGIFPLLKKVKKSLRGEYELTDSIKALAEKEKVFIVKAKRWLPIAYPHDLAKAKRFLANLKQGVF